jgi:hypothetical protein
MEVWKITPHDVLSLEQEISELKARIAELEAERTPRPIEWVPEEFQTGERSILAWWGNSWRPTYWDSEFYRHVRNPGWRHSGTGVLLQREHQPTHFLPMPQPPTEAA